MGSELSPAAEAQAEKRAAEDKRQRRQAQQLIVQLLAVIATNDIDLDVTLSRKVFKYLDEDASR